MQHTDRGIRIQRKDVVTIALWVIALSSHAFLLPKFLRDMTGK